MKLISLKANKPSFHPVNFKDGLNIVVGKQATPNCENDGNTYNGVGKSLILHLIHFCLGSNKIDSFVQKIPDWEFTLRFEHNGKEYYASRGTAEQNKINFCGEKLSLTDVRKNLLEICFGITDTPKMMTWNTLFSRFVRRYRVCYSTFDAFTPKEEDYSKLLNNCYLLGIDLDLIVRKKELRERQTAIRNTETALKKDPLFKQYYLGNHDAELDSIELQIKIEQLKKQIAAFKVSNNYHELEKEANEKSYQKKALENKRFVINNHIKNIEVALQETSKIEEDRLISVYEAAKIEIPEMVRKSLEEVRVFHDSLITNRNTRLRKDLNKYRQEIKNIDDEIAMLGERMDELLNYLNSHGALEEYVALTKELTSVQNEYNRIQEYQKILKAYKDEKMNIKASMIADDKEAEEYLEDEKDMFSVLKSYFYSYAKRFYPQKRSGLIINNNSGENMLRYSLDARIEDDSSDGVNEVRMFCFDLLLLILKKSNIQFLAHDSRLFANMDPRQRETLFRLAYESCCDEKLQYFCTINEDALTSFKPMMSKTDYDKIITDNIILELNDDSPQSKLLGVQIDIDLEGKGKTDNYMN